MSLFDRKVVRTSGEGSEETPEVAGDKKMSTKTDGEINALLGRGSEFEGKLSFEGTVRIDGIFRGEIRSTDVLIIGEAAKVEAEISVGTVIVFGLVKGNIHGANRVQLQAPAKFYGNIETKSFTVQEGVIFQGSCKMENIDKPKQLTPNSPPQPPKK